MPPANHAFSGSDAFPRVISASKGSREDRAMERTKVLRTTWAAKGNSPCDHPVIRIAETRDGRLTDERYCAKCGAPVTQEDLKAKRAANRA
jgi:hypothetical protein